MSSFAVMFIGRQYLLNPSGFLKAYPHPWLVWEPPRKPLAEIIETTGVYGGDASQERGDPMVIEVVKGVTPNAFPFGVTVGHSENNDIVLRHPMVSRFHAYFQEGEGGRLVADASSKNGTWLDGFRLDARKPTALPSRARLRFGVLEVLFLEPQRFLEWLERRAAGGTSGER